MVLGCLAQSVECPTADPGVVSLILVRSFLWSFFVSYERKYVHKVLVHHLVKFAKEKVWFR